MFHVLLDGYEFVALIGTIDQIAKRTYRRVVSKELDVSRRYSRGKGLFTHPKCVGMFRGGESEANALRAKFERAHAWLAEYGVSDDMIDFTTVERDFIERLKDLGMLPWDGKDSARLGVRGHGKVPIANGLTTRLAKLKS